LLFRANLEAPELQLTQHIAVAVRKRAFLDEAYGIHIYVQWSSGRKTRIKLPQASCCSVSRIDKCFLAFLPRLLIELQKTVPRHEHLSPYLQDLRICLAVQTQWDGIYRSQVVGYVLAGRAIPPCCTS